MWALRRRGNSIPHDRWKDSPAPAGRSAANASGAGRRTGSEPPRRSFRRFFIWNYCPLAFLEDSGRNRTPDKLPREERGPLYAACDRALLDIVDFLRPSLVLGVGRFGETRARRVFGDDGIRIGHILHPSPASPAANRGWAEQVERQLADLGVDLP